MFTFIHAADIHLDSPLRGLPEYEGAPLDTLRRATREALENLVHLALEQAVDFVLIAGDVYDGDWKDHNTGLYFVKQMARLKAAGIPVYLIAGNHDAQSVMTKNLKLPDNVHPFPTKKAATIHLESLGAAIHGQGFATKAVTADLTENYPDAVPGAFNIGLLHTSLTGYEGHDNYAPCSLDGLTRLGYDYWALGHIHQRECIQEEHPAVWFSGNIQGRHIREPGPRGCNLVTVDDRGQVHADFQPLDVLRWDVVALDITGCEGVDDVVRTFTDALESSLEQAEDRTLALRIALTGPTAIHDQLVAQSTQVLNECRAASLAHGEDRVYIEKLKVETTRPVHVDSAALDDGPLSMVQTVIDEFASEADGEQRLRDLLDPLHNKLPAELDTLDQDLDLTDPEVLRQLLDASSAIIHDAWRDAGGRG